MSVKQQRRTCTFMCLDMNRRHLCTRANGKRKQCPAGSQIWRLLSSNALLSGTLHQRMRGQNAMMCMCLPSLSSAKPSCSGLSTLKRDGAPRGAAVVTTGAEATAVAWGRVVRVLMKAMEK